MCAFVCMQNCVRLSLITVLADLCVYSVSVYLMIICSLRCRNTLIAWAGKIVLSKMSKRPGYVTWWDKCEPALE